MTVPVKNGWTAAQVAAELGYSKWWFYKNGADLVAKQNFPAPMAGTTRWDPEAVRAWKRAQWEKPATPAAAPARSQDDIDRILAERAAAIAAGGRVFH